MGPAAGWQRDNMIHDAEAAQHPERNIEVLARLDPTDS
jgi:hypothetical protein